MSADPLPLTSLMDAFDEQIAITENRQRGGQQAGPDRGDFAHASPTMLAALRRRSAGIRTVAEQSDQRIAALTSEVARLTAELDEVGAQSAEAYECGHKAGMEIGASLKDDLDLLCIGGKISMDGQVQMPCPVLAKVTAELGAVRERAPRFHVGQRVQVNRKKHPFAMKDAQPMTITAVTMVEHVTVDYEDGPHVYVAHEDDLEPAPPEEP